MTRALCYGGYSNEMSSCVITEKWFAIKIRIIPMCYRPGLPNQYLYLPQNLRLFCLKICYHYLVGRGGVVSAGYRCLERIFTTHC